MTKKLTYLDFSRTLQEMDVRISAAEAHGVLVGMLCLINPKNENEWRLSLVDIFDCNQPNKQQWAQIAKLKTKITKDFQNRAFSFNLLLPDDEEPLTERVLALANWCRGYLSGLGFVGISAVELSNEVVKELVQDLSQIAQANHKIEISESDEKNYTELVEYVRIAVQNIYVELRDAATTQILH